MKLIVWDYCERLLRVDAATYNFSAAFGHDGSRFFRRIGLGMSGPPVQYHEWQASWLLKKGTRKVRIEKCFDENLLQKSVPQPQPGSVLEADADIVKQEHQQKKALLPVSPVKSATACWPQPESSKDVVPVQHQAGYACFKFTSQIPLTIMPKPYTGSIERNVIRILEEMKIETDQ